MMKNDAPATGSDPKPLHAPAAARWREIGRLAAVCAVATLLVLVGISAYFNVIYATHGPEPTGTPTPAPPTGTPTPSPIPTPTPPWVRSFTLADLPAGPETLVFTEDGTRAAALKDGVVTVLDTATGKTVETLTEPAPITSCYLMVDQSILVYFYMDATDHTLKVSTYNFVTSLHYVRQTVPFPAGTTLKLTDYSKGMSFVVYQTATTGGSSTTYDLGWLNTSSHVRYTSIHHAMVRMLATNLIFHIYSESPAHALYQGSTQVTGLGGHPVQLFGIDAVDNAYAVSLSDHRTVYVVKGNAVSRTFQLPSPDYQALFTDKTTVYAAYDGYVLDLLATKTSRLDVPTGLVFVAASGRQVYLKDAAGTYYVFDMPFE